MKTELDVHDEFEKRLVAEIRRVKDNEKQLQEMIEKVELEHRGSLIKGSFHNEGMIAGLTIALHVYRGEP